jgi:hypothetical protein
MLKEDPTPMATHESGPETVPLGGEMGVDEGKDIQRNAINGSEGVHPFTDNYKCGRNVAFESRDRFQVEAKGIVSGRMRSECSFSTHNVGYAARLSSSLRAKMSCGSDRPFPG